MKGSRLKDINDDSEVEDDVDEALETIGVSEKNDRNFITKKLKKIVKNGKKKSIFFFGVFEFLNVWKIQAIEMKKNLSLNAKKQKISKKKSGDEEALNDVWK